MTTSPFVVNRWIPIYANSSIIHYTGDWNFTTYKPLTENSTASLNFTGSGISFAGYGNAGDETDEGILVNIDADSDSPYNTTLLLSYDYRGGSVNQGYRWFSKELPPGEHTVSALAKADNLNVTFVGFEVYINTTVPANSGVTQITENSTLLPENGQYWDLEYFGTQSKGDNSTTTVTGANSGFSFNFTGVALSIFAQEEFEQDTPYQVYFNLSDPTGSSKGSPYGEYPGKTGPANQIFWAGDLPAGEHKVVVINQGDSPLTLTSAVVDLPQFYNNQSTTCWADCKDATSGSGTAIGSTHEENGALSPKVGWGVMLAGLAMASAGVLTAL